MLDSAQIYTKHSKKSMRCPWSNSGGKAFDKMAPKMTKKTQERSAEKAQDGRMDPAEMKQLRPVMIKAVVRCSPKTSQSK